MKKIRRLLKLTNQKLSLNDWTLLLLPAAVWFSYQPLIELGQSDTMYFEISLSLVALTAFALTAIPHIWRARANIKNNKFSWLVISFGLWNTLTLIWTENFLRGFLTAGVIWLLVLAFLRLSTHHNIKQLLPAIWRIFVGSAVVVSAFAWLQMLLDIAGLPMSQTLICVGCQYEYFGFPRAVGFAIEPQFLGSLLLAPVLILIALSYRSQPKTYHYWLTSFLSLTLFMSLSRGAIYALLVGLAVLVGINLAKIKHSLLVVGLVGLSFVGALAAQGLMVAFNQNVNESFGSVVAKSVHHLSLGVIDLRDKPSATAPTEQAADQLSAPASEQVYFDGYVAQSTDARLSFNELAFDAWKSSPFTMLFGVGLGGAGVAMHRTHPDQVGTLEITQNEYTEILLELGLVGLLFFFALLIAFFGKTSSHKFVWAVAVAYLAQWAFFSGYPNAIHIYLVLFLLLVLPDDKLKKSSKQL
jgi:hypothetical protein